MLFVVHFLVLGTRAAALPLNVPSTGIDPDSPFKADLTALPVMFIAPSRLSNPLPSGIPRLPAGCTDVANPLDEWFNAISSGDIGLR